MRYRVTSLRHSAIKPPSYQFTHKSSPSPQFSDTISPLPKFPQLTTSAMTESKLHLIDVRTPAEFSTGFLYDAINLEYQLIDQLPYVLSERGIQVLKSDPITLYCRSGRRSGIALQTLKRLGYENVRDIGGFEAAKAILIREEALKGEEAEKGVVAEGKVDKEQDENAKQARQKSLGKLLDGLRELK
ncbi:hypothetical protein K469DRAFT_718622 [Zopfia rhizophila CBS 207.26]|uniref:Rhodanese domain-containing protein n=1 Tax=Zopfia rhizophila CBS 207.26 TaxID=1314779 RepID=A0A6A6DF73_9PEZI|nr:hypothetical protein K469DRAFT_718622 [Zopfia rhizophila CBS 207.26]